MKISRLSIIDGNRMLTVVRLAFVCLVLLMSMGAGIAHAQEPERQTGLHYFAIENLDSGEVILRGTAGSSGVAYDNLILAPNTRHQQWILQAATLLVGFYEFDTPSAGLTLSLPPILLLPSTSLDTAGDGLHRGTFDL